MIEFSSQVSKAFGPSGVRTRPTLMSTVASTNSDFSIWKNNCTKYEYKQATMSIMFI